MKKLITLLIVLFIGQTVASNENIFKHQAVVDNFVYKSVGPFNKKEIKSIRTYSKLIKEEQTLYAYNSLGVMAKRYEIYFEGIKVTGSYLPEKKFFLEKVEITTPNYKLKGGIQVGSTNKDLIKYFKYSGIVKGSDITYIGESEVVTFHFKNGVIRKIEFYVYTG